MNLDLDRLLDQVEDLSLSEPARAVPLAAQALERITEGTLRTQARAFLLWGSLRRTCGWWVDAENTFFLSALLLRRSGAVPADWLPWYERVAYLRRDQRRLAEAESYGARAIEICREHRVGCCTRGRALTALSTVLVVSDMDRAAPCAQAALQLLLYNSSRQMIAPTAGRRST